jgi:hypothetical protein
MKKILDAVAAIAIILSSTAVTIAVMVYLLNQQPFAHKSDIRKVEQTAVTASKDATDAQAKANAAQSEANAASAVVSTAVSTHGKKIKTAAARISQLETDYALLKKRVDDLDGTGLYPVKHAHQH